MFQLEAMPMEMGKWTVNTSVLQQFFTGLSDMLARSMAQDFHYVVENKAEPVGDIWRLTFTAHSEPQKSSGILLRFNDQGLIPVGTEGDGLSVQPSWYQGRLREHVPVLLKRFGQDLIEYKRGNSR